MIERSEIDSTTGRRLVLPESGSLGSVGRLRDERQHLAGDGLLAENAGARRHEGARPAAVVGVRVGQDQEAHGLAPGRLGDLLQDVFGRRGVRARVDDDDAVPEQEPADVGALGRLGGPYAVGELLDLERGWAASGQRHAKASSKGEHREDWRETSSRELLQDRFDVPGRNPRTQRENAPENSVSGARPRARRRPARLARSRAARTKSANSRRETGSPARFSGCHWTATTQASPGDSTASGRPSGEVPEIARPGATVSIAWWCRLLTRDLGRRRERREPRPRSDRDRVVEARLLLASARVYDLRGPLRRDVLHERAAERDVDDLQPPADPEHRRSRAASLLEEREVDPVPLRIDLERPVLEGRPAVARRVDVSAAAEKERIEGPRGRRERRHDLDRLPRDARLDEAPEVVVGLGEVRVPVEREGDAHRLYCRGQPPA